MVGGWSASDICRVRTRSSVVPWISPGSGDTRCTEGGVQRGSVPICPRSETRLVAVSGSSLVMVISHSALGPVVDVYVTGIRVEVRASRTSGPSANRAKSKAKRSSQSSSTSGGWIVSGPVPTLWNSTYFVTSSPRSGWAKSSVLGVTMMLALPLVVEPCRMTVPKALSGSEWYSGSPPDSVFVYTRREA